MARSSESDAGFNVFLLSLLALVLLTHVAPKITKAPRGHLNLRIFALGLCLSGLVLYITSYLPVAVGTAIGIWALKPILFWHQRRQQTAAPKPAPKECMPCAPPRKGSAKKKR